MKSFEENFPSLKCFNVDRNRTHTELEIQYLLLSTCLDKQKVRDVISKRLIHSQHKPHNCECENCSMCELLKELGLED